MAAGTEQHSPVASLTSEEVKILAMLVKHPEIKKLAQEMMKSKEN